MRKDNAQSLGAVIKDLMKVYGLDKKMDEVEVTNAWNELMGPAITNHTKEISVKNKVLRIKLDSGVLKEEFSYSKEKIVNLINEHLGKRVIQSVEIY